MEQNRGKPAWKRRRDSASEEAIKCAQIATRRPVFGRGGEAIEMERTNLSKRRKALWLAKAVERKPLVDDFGIDFLVRGLKHAKPNQRWMGGAMGRAMR
jgi:hypothetical protein